MLCCFWTDKSFAPIKKYLSLVSPVFKAMFNKSTMASRAGIVNITDFSYDVGKAGVDYIYGVPLSDDSIEKVVEVYKFVDQYDIDAARKHLLKYFEEEVNESNFCTIAKFAWTHSNEQVLQKCITFLASHSNLTLTKDFIELDQRLIMKLLQRASFVASNMPKSYRQYSVVK
uniref:BTB domain-containing protein n=1 Tax=Panagrellus redivivus TaxID=6233 RepID=A0A7E4ZZM1_PANRE